MDRRSAIKSIGIFTGTIITLPAWMVSCGISDTDQHASSFNIEQQQLLASVADTIIPAGNAIGALSVGADKFIQKIIDDCHEPPVGLNARKQLAKLDQSAKEFRVSSFSLCSPQQRTELLMRLRNSADKEEADFYNLVKTETIRAFNTSREVMEGYHGYKVAPGFYNGCVSVQAKNNA